MKQPEFPFSFKWGGTTYTATKQNEHGQMTLTFNRGFDGRKLTYENNITFEELEAAINTGNAKMIEEKKDPLNLTITVDSTALDATLATAKELEATLLRVKELMKCFG